MFSPFSCYPLKIKGVKNKTTKWLKLIKYIYWIHQYQRGPSSGAWCCYADAPNYIYYIYPTLYTTYRNQPYLCIDYVMSWCDLLKNSPLMTGLRFISILQLKLLQFTTLMKCLFRLIEYFYFNKVWFFFQLSSNHNNNVLNIYLSSIF